MSEERELLGRREILASALAVLPMSALAGCDSAPGTDDGLEPEAVGESEEELQRRHCAEDAVRRNRLRWRRLLDAHMGRENQHDLPGVLDTFSPEGEMIFNEMAFLDRDSIAESQVLFGMSQTAGALANTQVIPDREYFTDREVLIEGRLIADHVGQLLQFPAQNRRVELHYSAFYCFDEQDKLISERIVMNWAPLGGA